MSDPILLEKRNGGAFVTFNRPEVRNAVNKEILAEIADFLSAIDGDPEVRYLVFRGAGDHFMAGGDVGGFRDVLTMEPTERRRSYERRVIMNSDPFLLLNRLSIPVVTVAQGAVAGAGIVFLLAADICLASEDTLIVFAHGQLGLPLDLSLSYYLPRVVGWRKAKALALTSARLSAGEAQALGMIDQIHPGSELDAAAEALYAKLNASSRIALMESKRLLMASLDNDMATQMELEARAVGRCVESDDFPEGVSAFLERRKPIFKS